MIVNLSTYYHTPIAPSRRIFGPRGTARSGEGSRGCELSEEVVADALGYVLSDKKLLEQAVQDNRTGWQKVADAIADFIRKIKDVLSRKKELRLDDGQVNAFSELQGKAEDMAKLLKSALDTVQERSEAAQAAKENAATAGEGKYSLKMFKDGTRFVDVEADQKLFDGKTDAEKRRLAELL